MKKMLKKPVDKKVATVQLYGKNECQKNSNCALVCNGSC